MFVHISIIQLLIVSFLCVSKHIVAFDIFIYSNLF